MIENEIETKYKMNFQADQIPWIISIFLKCSDLSRKEKKIYDDAEILKSTKKQNI